MRRIFAIASLLVVSDNDTFQQQGRFRYTTQRGEGVSLVYRR